MTAHIQQVEGEVLGIDPVVSQGISSKLGARYVKPVYAERLSDRRWQNRTHVALCIAQLLLQPIVGTEQRLAGFGQLVMGHRELLMSGFELRDEACLALIQQRHVVGFLLELLHFIVLSP